MSKLVTYPQFPMNHVAMANERSRYGPRTYIMNQNVISDFHYGIDIIGKDTGMEDLVSPYDGKCIYLTQNDGTGSKTIVLAHGGLFDDGAVLLTKHAHCSSFYVGVNDKLKRNQPFAREGMTGNATGNHDHTETWIIPANVWFDGAKYYTYRFADQQRFAVDPLTIYRVYPHQMKMGWNPTQYLDLVIDDQEDKNRRVIALLESALQLLKE